jgi:hypothetical protein
VVRDIKTLDELIERTRDIAMLPEELRAQQRSFAFGNTGIANHHVTRDIIARVDADDRAHLRLGMNRIAGRRSLSIRAPLDP